MAGHRSDRRGVRQQLLPGDQRDSPNPYAARLWEEFLYSDEGQLLWLKGYSHPVRFQDSGIAV